MRLPVACPGRGTPPFVIHRLRTRCWADGCKHTTDDPLGLCDDCRTRILEEPR